MADTPHGLKDLFGSVPPDDGKGAPKDASKTPGDGVRQKTAAKEGSQGLAGALSGLVPPPSSPGAGPETAARGPAPSQAQATEHASAPTETQNPPRTQTEPVRSAPTSGGAPSLDAPNLAPIPPGLVPEAPSAPVTPAVHAGMGLSCVVVARGGVAAASRTIQALRLQTVATSLDLVIVADEPAVISASHFARVQTLIASGGAGYGEMAAAGVRAAQGELVAVLDDYAFPARDWAEAVLTHRHDRFAALGSSLGNANPRSAHSWSNMLLEYGAWREGLAGGTVNQLPLRNLVYRRDALLALGGELAAALEAGDASRRLAADGAPLKLEDEARLSVLNPSTRAAAWRARYAAGRLDAAARAKGLSLSKRLGKALAAALGGPARYSRDKGRIFHGSDPTVNPRLQGRAVLMGMTAEGLGRAAGFLRGPGRARRTRERMMAQRSTMLNKVDRKQFGG